MSFAPRVLGLVSALVLAAPGGLLAAQHTDPAALPPVQVQDLHYGDVLFHYWADQDTGLETLTRLEAYEHWGLMPHHTVDAQLLAAGLYLQLGLHNEAGDRFANLLNNRVSVGVRNRAWFYLAKIWYERGYYDRTEQALARIQGTLGTDLEGERTSLLVNSLMHQQRYDEAVTRLRTWQGPADWMAYARFNLGVALVRAGRLPEADPILTAVGTLDTGDADLLSLRDRANLALGFAYLQANQPQVARSALARVRLNGPYSSRALLADGWAQAALGQYRAALVPWSELQRRSLRDSAVQESYVAVPYALGKINAPAESAQYYATALRTFASESQDLNTAIAHVRGGGLLSDLLTGDQDPNHGWLWQLTRLPDAPQSRYLYELLADNDFQQGLQSFRDLLFMQQSLARWDGSMQAFGAMIDTRAQAYAQRLPRTDALLATEAPTHLMAVRNEVDSRLQAIETGKDVVALADPKERDEWDRIARMQALAQTLPPSLERDNLIDKLRLLKGVLYWKLDAAFKTRSYQEEHSLREVDRSLDELQNRWVRVERARATVATNNGDFASRVTALAARIDDLHTRLAAAQRQQAQYLDALAEAQLDSQQQRLSAYSEQARFALASIYDRASESAQAEPSAPTAERAEPAPADAPARSRRPAAPPGRRRPGGGTACRNGDASVAERDARGAQSEPTMIRQAHITSQQRCAERVGATLACIALVCMIMAGCSGTPRRASTGPTIGDLAAQSPVLPVTTGAMPAAAPSQAMDNYRQFLELQNSDPKLRAEALRRLADLNLDSGELERMSRELTQVDAQSATAIDLYGTLLKAYPNYPRNDQVLYQLARAYDSTGQSAQALATFDLIVARYPSSRDIGEVQFRRGELLFSAQRYTEAQQAYQAVIARGPNGSGFYPQSLYKHAWSQFKLGMNQDSLQGFCDLLDVTLVDRAQPQRTRALTTLGRADHEMVDDTLRVMSISFSYLDGSQSIDELMASRQRVPYAWLLYERLGDLYVQKQRYQDAAATYRAFVARDPVDEHAPTLSMAAIEAYRKGGFPALMLQGKLEYVQRYDFTNPFWQGRAHTDYPQVVDELKTNLRDVAEYYHASAQKTKSNDDYTAAATWYRAYLNSFPDQPDSAATNYRLADALFESKQYLPAAGEYEHTAYGYPRHELASQAGYAALVSYQKYEDSLPADGRAAVHGRAVEAALKFAGTFPERPESAGVLTRAAQDLYAAGDQARALDSAQLLLARGASVTPPQQRIALSIVGQVQFNQGHYPDAETAFTRALALTPANDPEHGSLTERLAATVYKQGDGKRQAGDQLAAADDFLRVTRLAPTSTIAQTAQYDAATALINAKQWQRAIDELQAYRRGYPNGQYRADVGRKLAVAYTAAGQAGPAAVEFERIASNPSEKPEVVHEALGQAADLYQQSGNVVRAVAMLEREVREFPTPVADAIELRQRLIDIALAQGELERAHTWQRELISADAAAGAARTDRTHYLAARAQLAMAQPARDAFRDIKLVAPLKRSLQAKQKALESAVQAYETVATYQVAETTTAATFETAELYHTLAQDLLSSERPKRLSADELEQYQSLLEDQAYPFEEKAISIHELNAQRLHDGVYDDSVRKSMDALAQLLPARYGKSELTERWIAVLKVPASPAAAATEPAVASSPAPLGKAPVSAAAKSKSVPPPSVPPPSVAQANIPPPTVPAPSAATLNDFQHVTDLANGGKDIDAALELQQFQLRYPGYATPALDQGLLSRRAGHLAEAEAALEHATQLDAADAIAWSELGVTLRQEGKFAQARTAYTRATGADPNYAPAHRNFGVLLDLYLGDPSAALPEFERYKSLTGEDKPVSTWIADLRKRAGATASTPGGAGAGTTAAPGADAPAAPVSASGSGAAHPAAANLQDNGHNTQSNASNVQQSADNATASRASPQIAPSQRGPQ